jgi:hypothetical protein
LRYCAKLRKESLGDQEQSPLSLWRLFSNQSPTSDVPNLKWLCRKARTPYKVVGIISSSSPTTAAAKVEPEAAKPKIGNFGNVYEEENSQLTLQQCTPLQSSRLQGSDDIALCTEEDGNKHCLVDIPIVLAEHPMMHQVCEGPISVDTCHEAIHSSHSLDSLPLADSPVELVRDQEYVQSTEQSSSTSVSVQKFFDGGSISMEGSISSHIATLGCRDEELQVQQGQETTRLCNNLNNNSVVPCLVDHLTISEAKCGDTVSAIHADEDGCVKSSCYLGTLTEKNKFVLDNQPESCDLGAMPMKQKSSCNEMICSADQQCRLASSCLGSSDVPGSTKPLSPHDLMGDELQVDTGHSFVKSVELEVVSSSKLNHESPQKENAQAALVTVIAAEDGQSIHNGSNSFDILLGALAEESKEADAPGKDEVGNTSLTLMTLANNDQPSAEVTEGMVVEMAKRDTVSTVTEDGQQVAQSRDLQLSDLVSRSIGRSNRTNVICYVRQTQKKERNQVNY